MLKSKNIQMKKGDTLIEVLLAFSVFSAAMVGGLWMMNNAMARAMGSTQITWARNAMDGQAEALRFINSAYLAEQSSGRSGTWTARWNQIRNRAVASASDLNSCPARGGFTRGSIVIDTYDSNLAVSTNLVPAVTYPRLNNGEDSTSEHSLTNRLVDSQGLWIEVVRGSGNYYDFHIRACWVQPGQGAPTTLGTIVRLYDTTR